MQALTLLIVFVLTAITIQFTGFLISRVVEYQFPNVGLMTFLILFFVAFGLAWPIAVRIAEWLIRFRGYEIETEQSGGDLRRDTRESFRADTRPIPRASTGAVMTEETSIKLVEGAKTPKQKREVRVYTMIVGTWMVCLILFGIVQLLGWIRV